MRGKPEASSERLPERGAVVRRWAYVVISSRALNEIRAQYSFYGYYPHPTSANADRYAAFFRGMLSRGVYPPPSQFEAWFLSAAHTAKDIDTTIRAARESMKKVGSLKSEV